MGKGERRFPARFVYFKATNGDRLGNLGSSETAAEIGGNTYGAVRPREISNSRYRMFQRLRACVPFQLAAKDQLLRILPRSKKEDGSLPYTLYVCVCARVRDRFRRICNILFCIENGLEAIPRRACPLNRMRPSLSARGEVPPVQRSPPSARSTPPSFQDVLLREVLAACHGRRRPVSLFSRSLFFE